jgi:HSP20 family protein
MTMATLTRWEPFGLELPTWMTRLLDERPFLDVAFDKTVLRIEECVEDGTLVVRAELPGVDVDKDVDISVHEGLLHIKAQRSEGSEHKEKSFYRSEFRYGAFERTLPLPPGATLDDVKATYENGVLEIRIPTKGPESKTYQVPVQRV